MDWLTGEMKESITGQNPNGLLVVLVLSVCICLEEWKMRDRSIIRVRDV